MIEDKRLAQAKQAIQKAKEELEMIRMQILLKEKAEEIETLKRGLQQQLLAKLEAAKFYRAQIVTTQPSLTSRTDVRLCWTTHCPHTT